MTTEPRATDLNVPVEYQRDVSKLDDWQADQPKWRRVASGSISLKPRTGSENEIADGIDSVQTYEAWGRWLLGITTEHRVRLLRDGRVLQIRSRVNWKERHRWARMVLVENKTRNA